MQQELIHEEELNNFVPVCGGNWSTPVTDPTYYREEISYQIAGRKYIENAD